jgi:hypothetical protein
MYYWQTYEQVQQEIKDTVESIRIFSEELRERGPEACRRFLIDAGIIEDHG